MLTGSDEPAWHGENESITEVEAEFDEVTPPPLDHEERQEPHALQQRAGPASPSFALDAALRDRMVRDVAAKLDTVLIASHRHHGTQPTGLLSYAGTLGLRRPAAQLVQRVRPHELCRSVVPPATAPPGGVARA